MIKKDHPWLLMNNRLHDDSKSDQIIEDAKAYLKKNPNATWNDIYRGVSHKFDRLSKFINFFRSKNLGLKDLKK